MEILLNIDNYEEWESNGNLALSKMKKKGLRNK